MTGLTKEGGTIVSLPTGISAVDLADRISQ